MAKASAAGGGRSKRTKARPPAAPSTALPTTPNPPRHVVLPLRCLFPPPPPPQHPCLLPPSLPPHHRRSSSSRSTLLADAPSTYQPYGCSLYRPIFFQPRWHPSSAPTLSRPRGMPDLAPCRRIGPGLGPDDCNSLWLKFCCRLFLLPNRRTHWLDDSRHQPMIKRCGRRRRPCCICVSDEFYGVFILQTTGSFFLSNQVLAMYWKFLNLFFFPERVPKYT